jgi:hypothetical protein
MKQGCLPFPIPRVFAPIGKRSVSKVVLAERGQTVSAVCYMSASGIWVPPCLIFPRKRIKDELFVGAPPGTPKLVAESGYMNTEQMCYWREILNKLCKLYTFLLQLLQDFLSRSLLVMKRIIYLYEP